MAARRVQKEKAEAVCWLHVGFWNLGVSYSGVFRGGLVVRSPAVVVPATYGAVYTR